MKDGDETEVLELIGHVTSLLIRSQFLQLIAIAQLPRFCLDSENRHQRTGSGF